MDATLEEDESYYFLQRYYDEKILHYLYRFPDMAYDEVSNLVNTFAFFCARVRDLSTEQKYTSNIPINVFRFMLLEDLNFGLYYTVRRPVGFVVEGAYWSNGMFYQVREDAKDEFKVYEVVLMIDSLTQQMHSFPRRDARI